VNIKDDKKRTPIHVAAASGNMKTTMLLLEAEKSVWHWKLVGKEKFQPCCYLMAHPSQ
jgi:hypothetical protein